MPTIDDPITLAARSVLPAFGLAGDLVALAAGHNHVFRVEGTADGVSRRHVLRLRAARHSRRSTDLQCTWLDAIHRETTVSAPRPIAALDGAWSVPAAGGIDGSERLWVVLEWVSGEPLSRPADFTKPAVLQRVGETIARLHQHAASFRPAGLGDATRLDSTRIVGAGSCMGDGSARRLFSASDFAALTLAATEIRDAMDRLWDAEGATGLIHADLEPGNWIFHEGEPRVIDFDEFGHGLFLFDLVGVLWSHVSWQEYPAMRRALLDGYGRVRPLSNDEHRSIDVIQAGAVFGWLNNGCRLRDAAAQSEFLKWVPSTAAAVTALCRHRAA